MSRIISWNTKKTSTGFLFRVFEIKTRKTPNKIGHYADTKILKKGTLATRARAKTQAQNWVRYYKRRK